MVKNPPSLRRVGALTALAAAAALCAGPARAWDDFGDLFRFGAGTTGILWIGGSYELSSGNYRAEYAVLGDNVSGSAGVVWQTGGLFAPQRLQLGTSDGWRGVYTLDGGVLQTGSTDVGTTSGWGTFKQNGGSHFVGGALNLGNTNCCSDFFLRASYQMQSGSVTAGSLRVGVVSEWTQSGGTATFGGDGAILAKGELELSAGTLQFGGTLKVERWGSSDNLHGTLRMSGGVLGGHVVVNGVFVATGGDMRGLLDNRAYGVSTLSGTFLADGGISNQGRLTLAPGSVLGVQGAGLNNLAGGVFTQQGRVEGSAPWLNEGQMTLAGEIAGSGDMRNHGSVAMSSALIISRSGVLDNSGSWAMQANTLTLGSGVQFLNSGSLALTHSNVAGRGALTNGSTGVLTHTGIGRIETTFINNGRVNVGTGTLTLGAGLGNEGQLVLQAPGSALAGGTLTNRGSIVGQGRIDNAISQRGLLRAEGGTLALHGAVDSFDGSRLQVAPGSTLHVAAGDLRLVGSTQLEGGTLRVAGALNNLGSINGVGTVWAGSIRNDGAIAFGDGASRISGALDQRSSGSIELAPAAEVAFGDAVTLRSGSLLKLQGDAVASFESALNVDAGARIVSSGSLVIGSALSLGAGATNLQVGGQVLFGPGSRYRAQVGGTGHDQLGAAVGIAFDGALVLEVLPGYTAQAGDRFQLFNGGQFGGGFSAFDTQAAALPAGLVWDFSALPTLGLLSVSAVPEPDGRRLLMCGLVAVGLWSQRRWRFRAP